MIELRLLILILWKWKWLLAGTAGLAVLTTFLVTINLETQYRVSTTLMVGGFLDEIPLSESRLRVGQELARNYAQLARQEGFLRDLIDKKKWDITMEELLEKVAVFPLQGTQLLEISVTDTDFSEACQIADEFAVWLQNYSLPSVQKVDAKPLIRSEIKGLETDIHAAREVITQLRVRLSEEDDKEAVEDVQLLITQSGNRVDRLRNEYLKLLDSLKASERILVLSTASGPDEPVYPVLWLNLLASVFGALVLTTVVILLIEYPSFRK